MKKFNYRYPGASVAYGPIYAENEAEARKKHRKHLKVKKLPAGYEFWEVK